MSDSLRETILDINDIVLLGRKIKAHEMVHSQCQGPGKNPEAFGVQVSLRWCSYMSWWPAFKQDSWLRKWVTAGNRSGQEENMTPWNHNMALVQLSRTAQSLTLLVKSIRVSAGHLIIKKSSYDTFRELADRLCNLYLQNEYR